MPLAEDRTEQYIRFHLSDFFHIDVLEILSHLPCLTTADQDKLRAYIDRHGNRDSVWKLFDHLRRRSGWVTCLITALRECELTDLAEVIATVYASNQTPGFQNHPGAIAAPVPPSVPARNQQVSPNTPPPPSAGVPGSRLPASRSPATQPAPLPDATYNGYLELEKEAQESYAAPIQDTQPPDSKSEVPGVALNPAHSGDASRNPQSSPGHSPSFSAPASTVPGKYRKASGGPGDGPPASASLPPFSKGPVSPSVSFVPYSKKAGPTSGPQSLPSPLEATASQQGNENHPAAASAIHGAGLPTSREPTTKLQEPQKVPPLAPKFPSPPYQVSPGPTPSGQVAPPHVEDAEEVNKPGVLQSCDDQPYSGGSECLMISSDSGSRGSHCLSTRPRNLPEENDYSSVTSVPSLREPAASGPPKQLGGSKSPSLGTFELHVDERASEGLLEDSPALVQTPGPAALPGHPSGDGFWGVWLGSAVAVVLVSVALAILYKRIQK